jgi:hypothetical protein
MAVLSAFMRTKKRSFALSPNAPAEKEEERDEDEEFGDGYVIPSFSDNAHYRTIFFYCWICNFRSSSQNKGFNGQRLA